MSSNISIVSLVKAVLTASFDGIGRPGDLLLALFIWGAAGGSGVGVRCLATIDLLTFLGSDWRRYYTALFVLPRAFG